MTISLQQERFSIKFLIDGLSNLHPRCLHALFCWSTAHGDDGTGARRRRPAALRDPAARPREIVFFDEEDGEGAFGVRLSCPQHRVSVD